MKVLIADDHPVVRQGLRQMLAVEQDLTVVGEARNGQEVVELSRRVPWEVAVLDYNMPGKNGLELIKELRQRYPGQGRAGSQHVSGGPLRGPCAQGWRGGLSDQGIRA
jgi:DNA-binding NarL/FixJ family response regulator